MVEFLLDRLELILITIAIISSVKSAYNGWLHDNFIKPLKKAERVGDIESSIDEIKDEQSRQTDAIIAVGMAVNGEVEFDTELYKRETERGEYGKYLAVDQTKARDVYSEQDDD